MASGKKYKNRRKKNISAKGVLIIVIIAAAFAAGMVTASKTELFTKSSKTEISSVLEEDWVTADLLTVNEYSRPGTALEEVNGIVVHYVANPGSTAQENRDYFENLSSTGETYASSHFIIGLDGEIIQCIPLDEIAYASNDRNSDTIAIECCHPGEDGQFTHSTYKSLVKLIQYLCDAYDLEDDDVLRHYDITGKSCPLYYVEHEDAWEELISDVFN